MKLLAKSTFYYLFFTSLIIFAGGFLLYFTIRKHIYEQIDEGLLTEKEIIRDQIEQTGVIPDFEASLGHQVEVRLLDKPKRQFQRIADTLVADSLSGDPIPHRYLYYTGTSKQGRGFVITVMQNFREKEDLLEDIGLYVFLLFLAMLLISLFLNYLISRKLWHPFYKTVELADKFDIQTDRPISLPDTDIQEFKQLNEVIQRMTAKMRNDYLNLKEYNENAAHEIQTPLAIIRSKLEILMQRSELRKESRNLIKSANEAASRLLKLNQGLLLISKIDNLYFSEEQSISLRKIIVDTFNNYKEIMELKGINVEIKSSDDVILTINETLAEILISNLVSNAVRYNINDGYIKCEIVPGSITISNTGLPLKSDPETLFRRFSKESDSPQSVGLGLSIVKKIAETYNMDVTYRCESNIHIIKLMYN